MKRRIFFVHSEVRSYRVKIFDLLQKKYQTRFLFTSSLHESEKLPQAKNWDYKYFKSIRFPAYASDVTPGIITYLIKERNNFDTIIFSGIMSFSAHAGFIISKILKKKIILWDETWVIPTNWRITIIKPYLRYMAKNSNALIAAGTKSAQFYQSLGADPKKISIAPNCAENIGKQVKKQKLRYLKTKLAFPNNSIIIGYLGRIVEYKNLDCLILAFSKLRKKYKNVCLLIVGDGPYAMKCWSIIERLGNERIIWIGKQTGSKAIEPVSHNDFIHYLDLVDIFVLPGRFMIHDMVISEAWGLVLNEVASLGKPMISTKSVGGAYDLIKNNENGFIIDPDNVDQMYQALGKLISDKALIKKMGQESKNIINEHFRYPMMLKGFCQAIEFSS